MIDRASQSTNVGFDSFRGADFGGSLLRSNLYGSTRGCKTLSSSGLQVLTESPLFSSSGILVCDHTCEQKAIRDPISGSTFRFQGNIAVVAAPTAKQALMRSRCLTTHKDIDSTIQTCVGSILRRYTSMQFSLNPTTVHPPQVAQHNQSEQVHQRKGAQFYDIPYRNWNCFLM